MIEIRIHGRGGQGNVVAAYMLATAAIDEGRYAQAFPAFGAERRGAPVASFVRIADRPIKRRCQVAHPQFLIIQDEALLHVPDVLEGLMPGGYVLVNSAHVSLEIDPAPGMHTFTLAAATLAQQHLGRPLPNTALLAAFLNLTGILPMNALIKALSHRFKGSVLESNTKLIQAVAQQVPAGLWKEKQLAASA